MRTAGLMLLAAGAVLAAGRNIEGNAAAKVRVIVYEDLQCSDCAVFRKMMDATLLPKYGKDVAFEHRDFPLAKHAWAKPAAMAGRFFDEENPKAGVEWRRTTMAQQKSIAPESLEKHLRAFALRWKIDPAKAAAALNDERLRKLVEADFDEGVARGVARTPTVFVDGEPFIEPSTPDEIAKSIEAALARSKR
ncbi:MAG: thioredoxin domain-containing protein [Bryobacteraceae bacterium]|nr:thioredoxin domain-containing protein [Bryobacteraceae bacterium]